MITRRCDFSKLCRCCRFWIVEGFGEGKKVRVMSRDDFIDVCGAVLVEEGMNVEGVGSERAVGWTRVWLNVSRQEEQRGNDQGGA